MASILPGVFKATKKDGSIYYRSSFTHKSKHISLGSFADPESAHHAYLEAKQLLYNESETLISLSDYRKDIHVLSFDKWVSLINLRDNGMYFATPIYIRKRYFQYYMSPSLILKFDIDDLFYFASHKIMKRGGHYFVADFGMQVSILGRFGIKSYAVIGRDYDFINGDTTDFRRENLVIHNQYHGVLLQTDSKSSNTRFLARIHVNGYYNIGIYDTMEQAAIAYNKAIDILHKQGVGRNYVPNYLEHISPKTYADIYSSLKVSSKLYSISPSNQ